MWRAALALAIVGALVLGGLAGAANYSDITTGTYVGKAAVPDEDTGDIHFQGGSYRISFRLTSKTNAGIRTIQNLALGPVRSLCSKASTKPGGLTTYVPHTLPRQTHFGKTVTNGLIINSFVLSGGTWKPGKPNTSYYTGALPHVDLGFVYNKHPARFNPNPASRPSVTVTYRVDNHGKISKSGGFLCTSASVVTVTRSG